MLLGYTYRIQQSYRTSRLARIAAVREVAITTGITVLPDRAAIAGL